MHTTQTFQDYFSRQATGYAKHRPQYPSALFEYLASLVASRERAWDCATGNGQAALGLTPFFQTIIATDASEQQIHNATPHEKISYVVAQSERSPIASHLIDVVTIAQAMHWLDFGRFYAEMNRVVRMGGVIAAWCYGWTQIEPKIDDVIRAYQNEIVGSCWPPERRYVDEEYATIPFPFEEIHPPTFVVEKRWNMHDLIGYLETWSSTRRFIERNNENPVGRVIHHLENAWGEPTQQKLVRWKLSLRVGRVYPRV